ncbi:rhomboid family intramembrane serine protease [Nocardioides sp. JQ2195]|nr:rhomboid family intramembrane serine protease [Nocardioides sp. JQ2195]
MVSAAVGFQCPECVQQGAKQTRSGRTPYGGLRTANPGLTSIVLIAINALVWLFVVASGGYRGEWYDRLALMGRGKCDATGTGGYWSHITSAAACRAQDAAGRPSEWVAGVADGSWWQLGTSIFLHVDVVHIAFNLLALWILGPQLEQLLGRARFLAVYLGSGLAGSAAVYWLTDPTTQTLGASGAVFGLMGALLIIGLKAGGDVTPLLIWIGINVVITFVGANISWQGHAGGFVGGVLLAGVLAYAPRQRRATWQALGVSAVMGVVVLMFVLRTLSLT